MIFKQEIEGEGVGNALKKRTWILVTPTIVGAQNRCAFKMANTTTLHTRLMDNIQYPLWYLMRHAYTRRYV